MTSINWSAWREEFPGLQQSTYLNTVSLGQLSRRSRAAVNEFLDLWTAKGASAWYAKWMGEVDHLRVSFARLVGASPEEIAILPSVAATLAAVSSSLDFSKRSRVVSCALDFPTLTHHFLALKPQGVELEIVPTPDGVGVPIEGFEQAVDDRTVLLATSRVYYATGFVQDVKALADIAHKNGALCYIDDYQGTGQLPINVKETDVDFFVTGGLKWLLGGPGVAYMYVRKELIPQLTPQIAGWFGSDRQFDFVADAYAPKPDARRFETGTPAVAAVYAGRAGLDIINEIGPQAIRERSTGLNTMMIDQLRERGYTLRIPENPDQRTAVTLIKLDDPSSVTKQLAQRGIIVDYRPGVVRVSTYFYNTEDEVAYFVRTLDEVLKR